MISERGSPVASRSSIKSNGVAKMKHLRHGQHFQELINSLIVQSIYLAYQMDRVYGLILRLVYKRIIGNIS